MAAFVLVHGAWHGGWCFSRVARILRGHGHEVYTPTLSGLGDRSHLYSPNINASTHVQDVLNLFLFEDLTDVVLVGHSYAGLLVTAVADVVPERIRSLVYLDGFVGEDGKSSFDLDVPSAVVFHVDRAQSNGGHTIPPVPSATFGVNPNDQAWVDSKCTPHPFAALAERLRLTGRYKQVTNKTYVAALGWNDSSFLPTIERVKQQPGWNYYELPCGHDVMVDMPEETAKILERSV